MANVRPISLVTRKFAPCLCQMSAKSLHTTQMYRKNIRTGIPKITPDRSKALTYEQAQKPYKIGVTKAWNSWNTSGLYMEDKELEKWLPRASETAVEDVFIRKFLEGTWQHLKLSEAVIKRRGNVIYLSFLVRRQAQARQIYFLQGYTEELLANILKCIVKVEVQTVTKGIFSMTFKKI